MKQFEKTYKQIINESTKTTNESIGKWIKNRTLNVTSGQIKKEMIHTFNEFVNNYHFQAVEGQNNTVAKKQDGYQIVIRADWGSSSNTKIPIVVTVKQGNKVLLEETLKFKDSFTEKDFVGKIDKLVNKVSAGFKLSSAVDNATDSKKKKNNATDDDDIDADEDDMYQNLDSSDENDQLTIIGRGVKRNLSEAGVPVKLLNKNLKSFLQLWGQLSEPQRKLLYAGLTGKTMK